MSTKLFLFLACLGICFGFSSCENDIDLLEDYREIPVIYGLINPTDTVQYVRVQRAFLGEGNALVMAQESDSIYYNPADIKVSLEKLTIGANTVISTQDFFVTTDIPKDEGLFTDEDHYLFKLSTPTGLDDNYYYRIRFENMTTGKVVTASTRIIEPMLFPAFSNSVKVNLANVNPYQIRFGSPKWGRVYGLIMRIKFNEYDTLALTYDSLQVDFKLKNITSLGTNGGEQMAFALKGEEIFKFMGSAIGPQQGAKKRVLSSFRADYLFTAGTDDLYNYIQVNSPNNVVNYVPAFTNLSDGRGLFTCRYTTRVNNVQFNELTLDSILNGQYTKIIFK